jgi:flagellar basal-body rod protein FlgC
MNPTVALSGMNAATARLDNSAKNIANIHSTSRVERGETIKAPYQPTDVVTLSQEAGGVITIQKERNNATTPVYDPESADADGDGMVQMPNVDLAQEVAQQKIATYDFKANLKVLEAQKKMDDSLLDIKV